MLTDSLDKMLNGVGNIYMFSATGLFDRLRFWLYEQIAASTLPVEEQFSLMTLSVT